jgi:hypothetical protein
MAPQAFPLILDLAIRDYILAAAFMPSIVGLLLAVIALWLPDEGYVLSQARDDRYEHLPAEGVRHDWRQAA